MSVTPVAIVAIKNSEHAKDVQRLSEKWAKRTKGLDPSWPKEGTFDVGLCEDMELRIKDYKPKNKSKKRLKKRELELETIKLFKVEGHRYRKNVRRVS